MAKGDGAQDHKLMAMLSLAGTLLIIIGGFTPYLLETFSPPSGFADINGARLYAYSVSAGAAINYSGSYIKVALSGLIISNILFDLPTLVVSNEGFVEAINHPVIQAIFGSIKGLAVLIQCFGFLTVLFLVTIVGQVHLSDLDTSMPSPSEFAAHQYLHVSLSIGFFFLVPGFLLALFVAARNIGTRLALILFAIILVLLPCGGFTVITHILQFLERFDPLQFIGL